MSDFQVGPQTFVTIRYQVFDAEGEVASTPEILGFVFGMGGLLPEVERALDGRVSGNQFRVKLSEKQAYGARNPKRILEVDREDFPDDVAPGDRFEVENEQGGLLVLHVLDVQPDFVVVDTNHPLSGQAVEFAIEVLEVRPASEDEIDGALLCLEDDQKEPAHGALHPVPDVLPSALIRGRSPPN